jgi:DNA-binding NarL/FixJ family response regulator
MPLFELKYLIVSLMAIDMVIIIVFILLIRRFKYLNRSVSFEKEIELFESLISDADKMAGEFKDQLEEKFLLVKRLNKKLDKKIVSLNVLLNRADAFLSSPLGQEKGDDAKPVSLSARQTKILSMEKEGTGVEEIADRLSIPKGEVQLILDLSKKFSEIHDKEGIS